MTLSYRDFVDGLEALSVTGVTRVYQGPPTELNEADLPSMWVQLPQGTEIPLAFGGSGYEVRLQAEVVIAVENLSLETQTVNFNAAVDMLDNLTTALRGSAAHALGISGPTSWTVRQGGVQVGRFLYWAITATVEVIG